MKILTHHASGWKRLLLLCFILIQVNTMAQVIMFDDFTYSSADDPQLGAFNKWSIINGTSGPPEGAQYSKNNVTFINDPSNANNKLMTLSTTVNGTTKATTHARIETNGFEYFEGTYAARVYLSDNPFTYKDANIQTFYTIVSSSLAMDGTKYSELDVIEYMAADKWGTSTDNRVMYVTSWHKYQAEPWAAWKTYFALQGSYAGWHTVIAQCTDGVNVKYWIDDAYLGQQSKTDASNPDGNTNLSVYPRSNMQVAFANWIWNNVTGSSTANRTTTMQADWVLYYKNTALTKAQIDGLVADYRTQGLQRRNLAGQTVITNPCTVPAQPGAITGNTSVAAGSSQTYSIPAVSGATSYTWTLPSGWSGSSTSTSITTTVGSAGGTISVRANNACGAGATRTLSVTVTGVSNNLALNRPATTSSIEAAGLEGNKAVDGNATTRWASAYADPQWINVDLGSSYAVNRVKITWEAAYGRDYLVQVSPDASSWTTIRTVTGNAALVNDWTGLSGNGRYVRVYGTARGTAWGYSIFELEVYGTTGCTVPAQPGTIAGNTTVAAGSSQTYSIGAVSGATSYTWTLPSGWSGSSTSTSITTTAGSAGGTISVRANNACGAGATRTLAVTVSGSGFTTRVEAENYAFMAGIITEACSEGGLNVGSFDTNDWTAYNVNIPATGTYKASFRVSSIYAGRTLRFEKDSGATLLGTVTVPNTGSWQTWTTVSVNVTMPAGAYAVGLTTFTGGLNINWFEITNNLARLPVSEAWSSEVDLVVHPNPVTTTLTIQADEFKGGVYKIVDTTGKEYLSSTFESNTIDVSSLPGGLFIFKLSKHKRSAVAKFIKE